jgi:hypothetical protein
MRDESNPLFSDAAGYMRETDHDSVLERVDNQGNLIGFLVLNVSKLSKEKPLLTQLTSR